MSSAAPSAESASREPSGRMRTSSARRRRSRTSVSTRTSQVAAVAPIRQSSYSRRCVQSLSPRDLHRLVDAVAEIGPLPGVEPFPVESFDLFGVLLHATREHTSELDLVAQALSSVAESGAEPTLLILGQTGGILFAQSAGRRLLASYFGRTQPGRAP